MKLSFTRIQTDDIDSIIFDEELLIELVQELGFDAQSLQLLSKKPEQANPESLFNLLHQRWSGEGQVFSLEDQFPLLQHCLRNSKIQQSQLADVFKVSRATPTVFNGHHIRVLLPHQVDDIAEECRKLPVEVLQAKASLDGLNASRVAPHHGEWSQQELISAPLWQIYDGLCRYFENAANDESFIFLSLHRE